VGDMWKKENKAFQTWEKMWPKFSMEEVKHNSWLHMINNLPTTWVEEFHAPFQQTKSKEWLGLFVNGSIHSGGTQKSIKAPRLF
jgi:hypothetical protein